MEDLSNIRKENLVERVEIIQGTHVSKEGASQLEQKLLKFQEELDQVQNLASLSFSLTTPDVNFPNTQNPTPPQNIPKPQNHSTPHHHCNTCLTSNNTPLLTITPTSMWKPCHPPPNLSQAHPSLMIKTPLLGTWPQNSRS